MIWRCCRLTVHAICAGGLSYSAPTPAAAFLLRTPDRRPGDAHAPIPRHLSPVTGASMRFHQAANDELRSHCLRDTTTDRVSTVRKRTFPPAARTRLYYKCQTPSKKRMDRRKDASLCSSVCDTVDESQQSRHDVTAAIAVDVVAMRVRPSARVLDGV